MLKLINASHITDDLAQHSAPTTNNSHTIRLVIMEDTKDDQEECMPRAASTRACLLAQWGLAAGDLVYGLCRPLPVKLQTPHYTPPAGPPLPPFLGKGTTTPMAGAKQVVWSAPANHTFPRRRNRHK